MKDWSRTYKLMINPITRPWLVRARHAALGLTLLTCLTATSVANTELAGVRYAPTMRSGNVNLSLNGSGIIYKAIYKQYTVGLYVSKKSSNSNELVNQPGPKQLRFVVLIPMRVDAMGKMLARGIELNTTRPEFHKIIPDTIEMGRVFSKMKRMYPGDTVAIDYTPQLGTRFLVNERPVGQAIAGPNFFNAVLKSWVGDKPNSQDLKNELLNVKASAALDALDDLDE
jgi:Chalcone isomerase-like